MTNKGLSSVEKVFKSSKSSPSSFKLGNWALCLSCKWPGMIIRIAFCLNDKSNKGNLRLG